MVGRYASTMKHFCWGLPSGGVELPFWTEKLTKKPPKKLEEVAKLTVQVQIFWSCGSLQQLSSSTTQVHPSNQKANWKRRFEVSGWIGSGRILLLTALRLRGFHFHRCIYSVSLTYLLCSVSSNHSSSRFSSHLIVSIKH